MNNNNDVIVIRSDDSSLDLKLNNQTFIVKYPKEDFNTGAQLIVHENEEALFFMNGQALDLFPSGRYSLETQNIPLINKHLNGKLLTQNAFHCEVYFINKTEQMAIKWGTDSQIEFLEPTYRFPIKIGASGEMSIRAEDSRKLLVKLVGTQSGITQQEIVQKMRAFLMTHVKTYFANVINEKRISIFEIDQHLLDISHYLREKINPEFKNYGLVLERFLVTTVVKPEADSNYQKFKDLFFRKYADIEEARINYERKMIEEEGRKQASMKESEAERYRLEQTHITKQEELGFKVAEKMAENEAVGQVSNLGLGFAQMGAAGAVGSHVGQMMTSAMGAQMGSTPPQQPVTQPSPNVVTNDTMTCRKCGNPNPKIAKFCFECGEPTVLKCPKCGTAIPTGGKFCFECGEKV